MDECDLIMQGGITSGVVYPPAVLKLAARYRFRSIGGTSAGAIAAAATAAAELGRAGGGFERLAQVPNELARCLSSLFQPVRPFRGVYSLFIACLGNRPLLLKALHLVALLIWHFFPWIVIGLAPVLIYFVRTGGTHRGPSEWIAIVAAALVGIGLALLARFAWLLGVSLPRNDFGVCSGLTQSRSSTSALTEWISQLLANLAGTKAVHPLTFGDLQEADIELKMMTTNLSAQRPYSLPFVTHGNPAHEGRYVFNVAEWQRYFPVAVIDWLVKRSVAVKGQDDNYRYLPDAKDLPIVVAVRMSLSFPFLLSAIPLYRQDWTYRDKSEREKLRRCIFSDGGISSNFPIHFFDSFLPRRPTFAIELEDYSRLRFASEAPADRVYMPQQADAGFLLPIAAVTSLPGFIGAIIDSARTWQDNLQRILAGYRERTAHIALTEFEGGLNLNMESTVIERLTELGGLAGDQMLKFDLQEHQWRRFLVAYARLEESLDRMNDSYTHGFKEFLDTYPPNTKSYRPDPAWLGEAKNRLAAVLELARPWQSKPLRTSGHIPKPDTDLRITPKP